MARQQWRQAEFPSIADGPVTAVALRAHPSTPLMQRASDPSLRTSLQEENAKQDTPRHIKYATSPIPSHVHRTASGGSKPALPPKIKNPPPEKYKKTFIAMLRGKDNKSNHSKRNSQEFPNPKPALLSPSPEGSPTRVPHNSPVASKSRSVKLPSSPTHHHYHYHHQHPHHHQHYGGGQGGFFLHPSSTSNIRPRIQQFQQPIHSHHVRHLPQTPYFIAEPMQVATIAGQLTAASHHLKMQ